MGVSTRLKTIFLTLGISLIAVGLVHTASFAEQEKKKKEEKTIEQIYSDSIITQDNEFEGLMKDMEKYLKEYDRQIENAPKSSPVSAPSLPDETPVSIQPIDEF